MDIGTLPATIEDGGNDAPQSTTSRPLADPKPRPDLFVNTGREQSIWSPLSPSPLFESPADFQSRFYHIYNRTWRYNGKPDRYDVGNQTPSGLSLSEFNRVFELRERERERDSDDVVVMVDGNDLLERLLHEFVDIHTDSPSGKPHHDTEKNQKPQHEDNEALEECYTFPTFTPPLTPDKGSSIASPPNPPDGNHSYALDPQTSKTPETPTKPTGPPTRDGLAMTTPMTLPPTPASARFRPDHNPHMSERSTLSQLLLATMNLTLPPYLSLFVTPLVFIRSSGCTKHKHLPFGSLTVNISGSSSPPTLPGPIDEDPATPVSTSLRHEIRMTRENARVIPSALEEKASRLRQRIETWRPAKAERSRSSSNAARENPHDNIEALLFGLRAQLCAVEWYLESFERALEGDGGEG